eukprot:TRINITY_DN8692_c0_g1_i1.p1 TRINITY_DN8692_c0_g1~~TRINITY_DN8692_c0_g1_i1.p1  ORF type:complete len:253 (-),score=88.21 TRINITY_DN8692_c0_g1_i1:177-902(-)
MSDEFSPSLLDDETDANASVDNVEEVPKEDLCKEFKVALSQNSFYHKIVNILHWRDKIETGLIFGMINFFLFLITVGGYTVITLVSYLFLSFLLLSGLLVNGSMLKATFTKKPVVNPLVARFGDKKFRISTEFAKEVAEVKVIGVNALIDCLTDAFYCRNNVKSLKIAGLLYVVSVVGSWFSALTLIYVGVLFAFVWPKLYEVKQKEIDQVFGLINAQVAKYSQLVLSKLPPSIRAKLKAE